jgi:hypothetical protein
MQQPSLAMLVVTWASGEMEFIPVKYNPTELTFNKAAQIAELSIPGLDSPLLQFVRGQTETLNVDLFFDTTEDGMGEGATSVTTFTDRIYELVKIEPERHAPPICSFIWNDKFPGCDVSENIGNQRRNEFQCVVESVRQRFTLFSSEGVPLRATLSVSLREYKSLDEQLRQLNLTSPDRSHSHVLRGGETLSGLAGRYYRRPGDWRAIAEDNGILDPRRLDAGTQVSIPPTR